MSTLAEQKVRKQLGNKIKELRNKTKMSQEQLSEKIRVSSSYLGFIEQGIRSPSLSFLMRIAAKLNVEIWELFKF